MATETIEARLNIVENELTEIKRRLAAKKWSEPTADWEKIFGTFAVSENFEEAMRLGREYREAQVPDDEVTF